MHNFTLSDEQEMVQETVRKFVADVAAPAALDHDEHRRYVGPQLEQLAELGMAGLVVPEDQGGVGLGWVAMVVALEEVAQGCSSTAHLLAVQAAVCGSALTGVDAGAALREQLCAGQMVGFVGPDQSVTATATGDGVELSGVARFVAAASEVETLLVAARTEDEPLLLSVPRASTTVAPVAALGLRAAAPGKVDFEGVRLEASAVLARGDAAEQACRRAQAAARLSAAAVACGLAVASLRGSKRHAAERIAFGKPLLAQQAVAHKLAAMRLRIATSRHLTYHAARLLDTGADAGCELMLAKLEAVEAAVSCADEGVQIHGGYGYVVEYHVERHYRDAKVLAVLDGGLETLRDAVAAGC